MVRIKKKAKKKPKKPKVKVIEGEIVDVETALKPLEKGLDKAEETSAKENLQTWLACQTIQHLEWLNRKIPPDAIALAISYAYGQEETFLLHETARLKMKIANSHESERATLWIESDRLHANYHLAGFCKIPYKRRENRFWMLEHPAFETGFYFNIGEIKHYFFMFKSSIPAMEIMNICDDVKNEIIVCQGEGKQYHPENSYTEYKKHDRVRIEDKDGKLMKVIDPQNSFAERTSPFQLNPKPSANQPN